MKSSLKNNTKNALIMRLERNQIDLQQLEVKLNAYTCEPQTQSLFERKEALRDGLKKLSSSNVEIVIMLNSDEQMSKFNTESITQHFLECNRLQRDIEDYLTGVRNS